MLESASRGGAWSRGVCLVWRGVPGLEGVCLIQGCLVRGGVPGLGVCAWFGGGAWSGGSGIPACTEADTPPPCGQTHTCKNITLATTSLRPVKREQQKYRRIPKLVTVRLCEIRLDSKVQMKSWWKAWKLIFLSFTHQIGPWSKLAPTVVMTEHQCLNAKWSPQRKLKSTVKL